MATVDTARVVGRRRLRFGSIDDLLAEVDRVVEADKSGKLKTMGNWTPGQLLGHLASWINYAYEGYPIKPPPWFIRVLIRMKLKTYLRDGMPAGVKIPGVEGGTKGTEVMSIEQGTDLLRQALQRLKSGEPAKFPSPAFGMLSDSQRVETNLRHAELHLGFLNY